MITRSHRFHGLNSLRHVYTHGRTLRAGLFAVRSELNPRRSSPHPGYRAAVVVSRKVHKSAVVRNRIRRRIYEILRRHEADITQSHDIVVTVFSEEVATLDAGELETLLTGTLSKAGILKEGTPATTPGNTSHPRDIVVEDRIPKEHS